MFGVILVAATVLATSSCIPDNSAEHWHALPQYQGTTAWVPAGIGPDDQIAGNATGAIPVACAGTCGSVSALAVPDGITKVAVGGVGANGMIYGSGTDVSVVRGLVWPSLSAQPTLVTYLEAAQTVVSGIAADGTGTSCHRSVTPVNGSYAAGQSNQLVYPTANAEMRDAYITPQGVIVATANDAPNDWTDGNDSIVVFLPPASSNGYEVWRHLSIANPADNASIAATGVSPDGTIVGTSTAGAVAWRP